MNPTIPSKVFSYYGKVHAPSGNFTHETESPSPLLHFKRSHWWKRLNRSKFASHYAWGTNGVCDCKMDVKSTWIPTWHRMGHVSWSLGLVSKNHLLEVSLTQTRRSWHSERLKSLIYLIYHVGGPACLEIHWNNIWLRAWSHMASHYTWGSVTTLTLHDFGGVLGWPLDTFFWALTISWSQLLAHVWSGP